MVACGSNAKVVGGSGIPTSPSRTRRAVAWTVAEVEPEAAGLAFDPQPTNLWLFPHCDPRFGLDYPGRMPGQAVMNLLWLYTVPGDLVLDPFAGGGTTIDVCTAMGRRCYASDRAPRREDILAIDVADYRHLTPEQIGGQASFVLLDPPRWSPKKGEYGTDPRDLASLELDAFWRRLEELARALRPLLDGQAHVALALSQARSGGRNYDLLIQALGVFGRIGYRLVERIVMNYGQASNITGPRVAQAKRDRWLLRGYREIAVFEQ